MKAFFETIKRNQLKYGSFMTFYIIAAVIVSVAVVLITKLAGDMSQAALEFDADVILRFLAVMAAITLVKALMSAASVLITGRFSAKTAYLLRENFARYFSFLPFASLEKKNSGAMLSLYANDMPQAVSFMTDGSLSMISDVISGVIAFVYMATINPIFTLIYFLTFPLLILMQVKISTPIHKKAMVISSERANFNAVVNDSLQNIPTVIAYSLETAMEERYLASYDKYYAAMTDYLGSLLKLVMSGLVATMIPHVFIYAVAGLSVANNKMSISEFIAFTSVSGIVGGWLSMLSQRLRSVRSSGASAEKINENTIELAEDTGSGESSINNNRVSVKFDNVSFSYQIGVPVLNKVSFEILRGAKVAVVGASGSGKSTILKLMLGLYEPDDGSILISGSDINGLSKSALRRYMAYVPQDCFMFPGSVRDNITLSKSGALDEEILQSCKNAGILDFINSLPDGFDTVLSESAENISGGQRQRLAIARAFLQDSPVILFDEATSALDSVTEDELFKTFGVLMKDRTTVMVAHRIKAIDVCDTVIFMDHGKIAGVGTHEELLTQNDAYAAIYESLRREEKGDGANE